MNYLILDTFFQVRFTVIFVEIVKNEKNIVIVFETFPVFG